MKPHTFLLLLLLVIIFFPESQKIGSVDQFLLHASEGMVAVQYCITDFSEGPTPIPDPVTPSVYKCNTCKDTGKVKSGDGIFEFPCPDCQVPKAPEDVCQCGCNKVGCLCAKSTTTNTKSVSVTKTEGKKEGAVIIRRVLLFTQPANCAPCAFWNANVRPLIVRAGYSVSNKVDANIREINPTGTAEEQALWVKYQHLGRGGIPLFVALDGEIIKDSKIGAISEVETLKLLGK